MSVFPFSLLTRSPVSSVKTGPRGDLDAFFDALSLIADCVENLSFRFGDPHDPDGFVQMWGSSDHWLQIHRIWARYPNRGDGSRMLQMICDLADEHDIGIRLKVIPIGPKPYPLPRVELKAWYERFGFAGKRWNMQRLPRVRAATAAAN